jgi:hypothetical protein
MMIKFELNMLTMKIIKLKINSRKFLIGSFIWKQIKLLFFDYSLLFSRVKYWHFHCLDIWFVKSIRYFFFSPSNALKKIPSELPTGQFTCCFIVDNSCVCSEFVWHAVSTCCRKLFNCSCNLDSFVRLYLIKNLSYQLKEKKWTLTICKSCESLWLSSVNSWIVWVCCSSCIRCSRRRLSNWWCISHLSSLDSMILFSHSLWTCSRYKRNSCRSCSSV